MMGRRMTCHFYLNFVLSFAFGPFHFHTLFRLYIYFLNCNPSSQIMTLANYLILIDELF